MGSSGAVGSAGMSLPLVAVLAGGAVIAWTFCELIVIHEWPRWARYVGHSVASVGADLPDRYENLPTDLAGLAVDRLSDGTYVIRTRSWGSGGTLEDANLAGLAYALVKVEGRHWAMDVRVSAGYHLVWVIAPFAATWFAFTRPLPTLGRVGLVLFALGAAYAAVDFPRRVRARFVTAARYLTSGGAAAPFTLNR